MSNSIERYIKSFGIDLETDSEFRKALSYSRCDTCAHENCKGMDLYGKCENYFDKRPLIEFFKNLDKE